MKDFVINQLKFKGLIVLLVIVCFIVQKHYENWEDKYSNVAFVQLSLLLMEQLVAWYGLFSFDFSSLHHQPPLLCWFSYLSVSFSLHSFIANQHFPNIKKIMDLTFLIYPNQPILPLMQFVLGNK